VFLVAYPHGANLQDATLFGSFGGGLCQVEDSVSILLAVLGRLGRHDLRGIGYASDDLRL
jgi:hypothetical protein